MSDRHPPPEVYTIVRPGRAELVVQRSRFLGFALPVADLGEAKAHQEELRARHPGSAHVVWAARLVSGEGAARDDGEPAGTGGRPLQGVLEQERLIGAALYVVRYFGGRKLGRPRLAEAYRAAARAAAGAAVRAPWRPERLLELRYPRRDADQVRSLIEALAFPVPGSRRAEGDEVVEMVAVPEENRGALDRRLQELTRGRARMGPSSPADA